MFFFKFNFSFTKKSHYQNVLNLVFDKETFIQLDVNFTWLNRLCEAFLLMNMKFVLLSIIPG